MLVKSKKSWNCLEPSTLVLPRYCCGVVGGYKLRAGSPISFGVLRQEMVSGGLATRSKVHKLVVVC